MNDAAKLKSLRRHKTLATGLFVAMLVIYVAVTWALRTESAAWMGYVKAFTEAAMVGALADWFAVTALFHHPLGLPIPHTNLIEKGKGRIGANLGAFVVDNFLTPANIRPYLQRMTVSAYLSKWLLKKSNKEALVREALRLLGDAVRKMDDRSVERFIARKGSKLLGEIKLPPIIGSALQYFVEKGEHEPVITTIAGKMKMYIRQNETLVRERVKSESFFFIPNAINNKLADKITAGLAAYFEEIEGDDTHRLRSEISGQLLQFAESLATDPKWNESMHRLQHGLLSPAKLEEHAAAAWASIKGILEEELRNERGRLFLYLTKTVESLAADLQDDPALQQKIDGWIHYNAYRLILRNRQGVGTLISSTVGGWQGRQLSQKLELEVGKDLQFIRINGTLVGGLVGLLIHAVTEWTK